jgi:hypothetical protein
VSYFCALAFVLGPVAVRTIIVVATFVALMEVMHLVRLIKGEALSLNRRL